MTDDLVESKVSRSKASESPPRFDVVVVGGGQAGLALGRELATTGLSFLILDASAGPGEVWRQRWDSLRLFTPAAYSALPGLEFPASAESLPTKDQVADYLRAYCEQFDLPARWASPVVSLTAAGGGPGTPDGYLIRTPTDVLRADQVVVATGPFQRPYIPDVAVKLHSDIVQIHSGSYRNSAQLPDGPVIVVGAGNSGIQIADELSSVRPTTLAVGKYHPYIPKRLAGRSIFWWLDRVGFLRMRSRSRFGRYARRQVGQHGDPVIGETPKTLARRTGVALTGRIVAAEHDLLRSEDGVEVRPVAVVWATGYRPDFSWIDLPIIGADGWIRQQDGRTDLPGLYTLGMPWQRTSASAFLGGIGADARDLAQDVVTCAAPAGGR